MQQSVAKFIVFKDGYSGEEIALFVVSLETDQILVL